MKLDDMLSQPVALPDGIDYDDMLLVPIRPLTRLYSDAKDRALLAVEQKYWNWSLFRGNS